MIKTHLLPHPAYPYPALTTIEVQLEFTPAGDLCLRYVLSGALAQFNIPPQQSFAQADKLWEHTCFEVFIALAGSAQYLEYNFAPSGLWAVYAFSDYRVRQAIVIHQAPELEIVQEAQQLLLTARIDAENLPLNPDALVLEIGLTAVLEGHNTSLSYWALQHPAEQPDFHHRGGFKILSVQETSLIAEGAN